MHRKMIAVCLFLLAVDSAYAKCGKECQPVKTGTDADATSIDTDAIERATISELGSLAAPAKRTQRVIGST